MSTNVCPISSAVIIPPDQSPPPKRRQSSSSEAPSKRTKVSNDDGDSPSTARASPAPEVSRHSSLSAQSGKDLDNIPSRRKNSIQEEKKRGQRLFGGLLSTLSQSTPTGQQKRRQDIEKRQAEKAKQQKLDDEVHKAEKLAHLKIIREAEQIKFNEESMRIRHTSLLATANFLATKTEPKLFYKPWELLPAQKECLSTQAGDAKVQIEREKEDFYQLHPTRRPDPSVIEEHEANNASEEIAGEPQIESPSACHIQTDTTNILVQDSAAEQERASDEKERAEEHNGEVVEVADEDTVIY
ncbi:pinin/SDK/memA/ protein conserved region-domain-containing protein [Calycina marina]|uniref:Pinin/SDK/memA/ protein conserved region-domain-containing protein n=1 Tax=Calycina marina TaxID=1763456 RepID=A0A9P7YVM5_9HELO|nr:pinin/SDK/memA/ protein conserved region-domain-containing protein [Calycina marina]